MTPDKATTSKQLLNFALALLLTISPMGVVRADPIAEVVHWWSRGADARAFSVFTDEFIRRGGEFFDNAKATYTENRDAAVNRLSKGYPPTLVQWNSGWDVQHLFKLGLTAPITDPDILTQLHTHLNDNVKRSISVGGEIVALPVNIHNETWAWYNQHLLGDSIPAFDAWDRLLQLADTLPPEVTLLAVGEQPWQRRILFNTLLLGSSQEQFERFYKNLDIEILQEPLFTDLLERFISLAAYSHSFGDGNWDDQVEAIASAQAAVLIMGDWAHAEFATHGAKLDRDFGCIPAPGTHTSLLPTIDVFIQGRVSDAAEVQGQLLMLQVMSDAAVNRHFNQLKGSTPLYQSLNDRQFTAVDRCRRHVLQMLQHDTGIVEPFASYGDSSYLAALEAVIKNIWDQHQSVDQAVAALRDVLTYERLRRTKIQQSSSDPD